MSSVQVIDMSKILSFIEGICEVAQKIGKDNTDIHKMLFLGIDPGPGKDLKSVAVDVGLVDYLMNAQPQLGAIRQFAADVIENKNPQLIEANKQMGFTPNFVVFMCEAWMSMIETSDIDKIDEIQAPSKDPKRIEALTFLCIVQDQEFTANYQITRDDQGHAIVSKEPIGGTSGLHQAIKPQEMKEHIARTKQKPH